MEAWTENVGQDVAWEKKTDDRMLWRGKNTGIFFKDSVPWSEPVCDALKTPRTPRGARRIG